jgi:shikimate dehydrogenase
VAKVNIALSGFMASGKTTVGRLLSRMLGLPLVDTDMLIQEETGRSIRRIFEQDGEERFRELERQVIARESERDGAVLAVGGGVVLDQVNVDKLKRRSVVYFLAVSPEEVAGRAGKDAGRPLLGEDLAAIEELMASREASYRDVADVVVETSGRTPAEVAEVIAADFASRAGE